MSGIWDLLFGRGKEDKQVGLVQNPKAKPYIPTYEQWEMQVMNDNDALYPVRYDYANPPVASTAYQKPTASKAITHYFGGQPDFDQGSWDKFLKRNEQRMHPYDLDEKIREDLLANRSAVIAEARDASKRGIRTGDWMQGNTAGESRMDAAAFWASRAKADPKAMPTYTHETLHQYFRDRAVDGSTDQDMREYLLEGGNHHALIDVLDRRLNDFDNYYISGAMDEKKLDALERSAEKRIGERMSKQYKGRTAGPR